MKTIKCVSLSFLLLGSLAFGDSVLKDRQLEIPFGNTVVGDYEILTAVIPVNQNHQSDVVCTISSPDASHSPFIVLQNSSNISYNPNDSQDGSYQMIGSNVFYVYKFKISPSVMLYPMYMRFYEAINGMTHKFIVSCKYS